MYKENMELLVEKTALFDNKSLIAFLYISGVQNLLSNNIWAKV
jgi:hypothetical protein